MKILKALVSILISLSVLLASSCSGGFGEGVSELVIGVENISGNLNPFYASTETEKIISSQIYGSIQTLNTNNSLVNSCGGISYEYVGENQVKYTVTLRRTALTSQSTTLSFFIIL